MCYLICRFVGGFFVLVVPGQLGEQRGARPGLLAIRKYSITYIVCIRILVYIVCFISSNRIYTFYEYYRLLSVYIYFLLYSIVYYTYNAPIYILRFKGISQSWSC